MYHMNNRALSGPIRESYYPYEVYALMMEGGDHTA